PAATFQHLVESLPRRVEAVIAAKAGPAVQGPLGHRLDAPVPPISMTGPMYLHQLISTKALFFFFSRTILFNVFSFFLWPKAGYYQLTETPVCVWVCVCVSRRSYVGVELVQWLCEQCVYVRCRSMAVRVWQVLLELGILLSVDQRVVFGDSNSYYQFSFEECESAACEFCGLEKEAWPEAVRLLLQLVPYLGPCWEGGVFRVSHRIPVPSDRIPTRPCGIPTELATELNMSLRERKNGREESELEREGKNRGSERNDNFRRQRIGRHKDRGRDNL
uniref:Rap guanine nucleotide exchange factor 5 n=1 Tax=Oncorhynchus mykiss TaxID=8022 RepID=A0A8K9UMQ9_ONCMY